MVNKMKSHVRETIAVSSIFLLQVTLSPPPPRNYDGFAVKGSAAKGRGDPKREASKGTKSPGE